MAITKSIMLLAGLLMCGVHAAYAHIFPGHQRQDPDCDAADIIFILDESRSIYELDFPKQQDFVTAVGSHFNIDEGKVHVGAVAFDNDARMIFNLGDVSDTRTFNARIKGQKQGFGDQTMTDKALDMTRAMFRQRGRADVNHILIVITDGGSTIVEKTEQAARNIHNDGIIAMAVGVGNKAIYSELLTIASNNSYKYVFTVDSYDGLKGEVEEKLSNAACHPMIETCTQSKADIVFAVPQCLSEDEAMAVEGFIRDLSVNFTLGPDNMHVGLASAPTTYDAIDLNQYDVINAFHSAVGSRLSQSSNLISNLEWLGHGAFQIGNGGRRDAVKIAIVVVNGRSANSAEVRRIARTVTKQDIKIIAIGIDEGLQDAIDIANVEYFDVRDYRQLRTLPENVIQIICQVIMDELAGRRQYNRLLETVRELENNVHRSV